MTFSYGKLTTLRPQKGKGMLTFFTALIVAAIFFVPYMILSKGYFIFYGDFNVQQIPFYQMCHKAIKTGNISWNWNTDLGVNFIGSYAFYLLGSPFFWITLFFPNSFVPYLMGPLLILKFAFAALTGYLYIRRFTRTSDAAYLGGLLYAFSGFSVYNIFFNHFHEAIICLPLLLLAMELLITENRRGVFAIAVCISALVNYFFFFGMVVFAIIYFFVRLFSGAIKVRFARFMVLIFEAVLGVGMASILLIPSYMAIIGNSRISNILLGWNAITYGKEQIYLNIIQCFFFPPDLPARPVFFPNANVKWSSLGGWLPLFGMTGVFTWFITKGKTWLKRLLGICIFMALVPILNSAFYAFNTAYYARWFYMPILMMCLATAVLSEDRSVDWSSGFKWATGVTLGFIVTIGLFPQKNSDGKIIFGLYTQGEEPTYIVRFWLSALIAVICLILMFILLEIRKNNHKSFIRGSIICVCAISVIYANVFVAMGRSHSYDIKDVMIDKLIEGSVQLEDNENYRIDTFDCVDNTGLFLGLPSINAFHSIVPASVTEFYKYIGEERSVASRPSEDIPAIRPLLSVKYLLNSSYGDSFIDENGYTKMPDYKYLKTSGGYYIYENENYIPYGFSYDYYMSKDFCDGYSDESRTRLMLKAMLLSDEQIKKYSGYMTDIETIRDIGVLEDGEQLTLSLSDEQMKTDCSLLAKTSADNFDIDNNGFTLNVKRDKKSLVFISVPYDEGFTATVNGREAEIEKVNVGFMAVAVDKGESKIRFNYTTPGLDTGIKATLVSLTLFLIYFLASAVYLKDRPGNTKYPEGDKLLEDWHKQDIADLAFEHTEYLDYDRQSILDDLPDFMESNGENNDFGGGFKIDTSKFDDD